MSPSLGIYKDADPSLDGADDGEVSLFAAHLQEMFRDDPDIQEMLRMANGQQHPAWRALAMRRAVEFSIAELLGRAG